jgi:hypothetical protein
VEEKKKKTKKKRKRIGLGLFDQFKAQGPNCFLHPQGPGPVGPTTKGTRAPRTPSTNPMSNSFPKLNLILCCVILFYLFLYLVLYNILI